MRFEVKEEKLSRGFFWALVLLTVLILAFVSVSLSRAQCFDCNWLRNNTNSKVKMLLVGADWNADFIMAFVENASQCARQVCPRNSIDFSEVMNNINWLEEFARTGGQNRSRPPIIVIDPRH